MTDEQIVDRILAHEGGYVDHPADRGGPTNFGITQATLSQWRKCDVSAAEVQTLSVDEAREIYQALYVSPFDGVDPRVKAQLVDIAGNSGVTRARALLAKAQQQPDRPLPVQLVIERLEFYAGIVERDHTQAAFIKGWVRRACSFLVLVLLLSGCAMHGVERVNPSWKIPPQYAGCQPRGDKAWIDGAWQVYTECLDGVRLFNENTHKETLFVPWREIR